MIGFEAAVTDFDQALSLLCIGLFGINLGNETLFASRCFDHLLGFSINFWFQAGFSGNWRNLG